MKIDKELLHKIAHLSRLDFNEQDEQKMLNSMNSMANQKLYLPDSHVEAPKLCAISVKSKKTLAVLLGRK